MDYRQWGYSYGTAAPCDLKGVVVIMEIFSIHAVS